MQKNVNNMQQSFAINQKFSEIFSELTNKDGCKNSFQGLDIATAPINLNELKNRNNTNLLELNQIFDGISAESITLTNVTPVSGDIYKANLLVTLQKENNFIGGKFLRKNYLIYLETDGSGMITNCFNDTNNYVQTAKEEICLDLGGTYESSGFCNLTNSSIMANNVCSYIGGSGSTHDGSNCSLISGNKIEKIDNLNSSSSDSEVINKGDFNFKVYSGVLDSSTNNVTLSCGTNERVMNYGSQNTSFTYTGTPSLTDPLINDIDVVNTRMDITNNQCIFERNVVNNIDTINVFCYCL